MSGHGTERLLYASSVATLYTAYREVQYLVCPLPTALTETRETPPPPANRDRSILLKTPLSRDDVSGPATCVPWWDSTEAPLSLFPLLRRAGAHAYRYRLLFQWEFILVRHYVRMWFTLVVLQV